MGKPRSMHADPGEPSLAPALYLDDRHLFHIHWPWLLFKDVLLPIVQLLFEGSI